MKRHNKKTRQAVKQQLKEKYGIDLEDKGYDEFCAAARFCIMATKYQRVNEEKSVTRVFYMGKRINTVWSDGRIEQVLSPSF